MAYGKLIRRVFIATAVTAVTAWFAGNLGLYMFIRYAAGPELLRATDYVPTPLILDPANSPDAPRLRINDITLPFPFNQDDIRSVLPAYLERQDCFVTISFKGVHDGRETPPISSLLIQMQPANLDHAGTDTDPWYRGLLNKVLFDNTVNYMHKARKIEMARFSKYSWWNLVGNIRLFSFLLLKFESDTEWKSRRAFEVSSPFGKALLVERKSMRKETDDTVKKSIPARSQHYFLDYQFQWLDSHYSITFFNVQKDHLQLARNLISGIKPANNSTSNTIETEVRLSEDSSAMIPEELKLISEISVHGPSSQLMDKLIAVMEEKEYGQWTIKAMKEIRASLVKSVPVSETRTL